MHDKDSKKRLSLHKSKSFGSQVGGTNKIKVDIHEWKKQVKEYKENKQIDSPTTSPWLRAWFFYAAVLWLFAATLLVINAVEVNPSARQVAIFILEYLYPTTMIFHYLIPLLSFVLVKWERGPIGEVNPLEKLPTNNLQLGTVFEVCAVGLYFALVIITQFNDGIPSPSEVRENLVNRDLDNIIIVSVHFLTCFGVFKVRSGLRLLLFLFRLAALGVDIFFIMTRVALLGQELVVVAHGAFALVVLTYTVRMAALRFGILSHVPIFSKRKEKQYVDLGCTKAHRITVVHWIVGIIFSFVIIIEYFLSSFPALLEFWTNKIANQTSYFVLALTLILLFFFALDAFMLYMTLVSNRKSFSDLQELPQTMPEADIKPGKVSPSGTGKLSEHLVALLIACYKSESVIERTLYAALCAGVPPRDIYVCHNGGSDSPVDMTSEVVEAFCKKHKVHINYIWLPEGNKTITYYYVTKNFCESYPLVMMIDDDVLLPPNMDFKGPLEAFQSDHSIKACAYAIRCGNLPKEYRAENSEYFGLIDDKKKGKNKEVELKKDQVVVGLQNLEYLMASYTKYFQSKYGSALFCHGAISLWERQILLDVFSRHNGMFDGDDLQMGLILHGMNKNYRIITNTVTPVYTVPPTTWFVEPVVGEKSLMRQRVFSWDLTEHRYVFEYLKLFFFNWTRSNLILKPFVLDEIMTVLQDWTRYFLLIYFAAYRPALLVQLLMGIVLFQYALIMIFDKIIVGHRPQLQSRPIVLLLFPLYKILLMTFRFFALCLNLMFFTPWVRNSKKISQRKFRDTLPPRLPVNNLKIKRRWSQIWNTGAFEDLVKDSPEETRKGTPKPEKIPPGPIYSGDFFKRRKISGNLMFSMISVALLEITLFVVIPYIVFFSGIVEPLDISEPKPIVDYVN